MASTDLDESPETKCKKDVVNYKYVNNGIYDYLWTLQYILWKNRSSRKGCYEARRTLKTLKCVCSEQNEQNTLYVFI